MKPEDEANILSSLYDRLIDAATYTPKDKSGGFASNSYFQMCRATVLNEADFANMMSPLNPNGDMRSAENFAQFVDRLPEPAAEWRDSGKRLSDVVEGVLAKANTDSHPDPEQLATYKAAYEYLNTTTETKDFKGNTKTKVEPSGVALDYDAAKAAYVSAVMGYRTAYNGYDLNKTTDQRQWAAVEPGLRNLVDATWNGWTRADKAEVEEAQAAMASSINDAVRYAIEQQQANVSEARKMPSMAPGGKAWLPSFAMPSDWSTRSGQKLTLDSSSLNKSSSSRAHSYATEASASWGLFHATTEVSGKHETSRVHLDASHFTLEADLITVSITRPWYNPLLLGMDGWWVNGYQQGGLSDGNADTPGGAMPLVPVGFVVARNVKVGADFSSEDEEKISKVINTSVSGGWGPFSVKGKYGYSASDESYQASMNSGKISFPGLQVIGWISTVPPLCPPRNVKQVVNSDLAHT